MCSSAGTPHFPGLVVSAENLFDRSEANSQSSSYSTRWVLSGYERTAEAFLIKVLLQLHDRLTCAAVKGFSLAHVRSPPEQSSVGLILPKKYYTNKSNKPDKRVQGHVKQAVGRVLIRLIPVNWPMQRLLVLFPWLNLVTKRE